MGPLFVILQGLTVLVVLVVCSNVANLLLQRGAAREHEIGVRLALGARPWRVVRQLMTESLLLGSGGVVAGGAVLLWARNAFNRVLPASPLPIVTDTPVDLRVVLVLGAVGASTVFVFGLVPAMRSARIDVRGALSGGGSARGGSAGSGRLRGLLVSAQFALSLAVLITAALFLRRLDELHQVDRGFRDPEQVLLSTVDFIGVRDDAAQQAFVARVVERLRALPGVRSAAAASFFSLGFLGYSLMETKVDGYVPQPGESMSFLVNRVSDAYFATMGIRIVSGRPIDAADSAAARPVAVVNEAFARRFWGTQDPIGRGIRVGSRTLTIVGVASDGKYYFLSPLDAPSPPFVYLPFAQWGHFAVVLHVRAAGAPLALVPAVQQAVAAADGRLNAITPSTLDAYSSAPFLAMQIGSGVLSVLGAAALMLASVGLYAVTAYAVTQQRRAIGIRVALGATHARVVADVLEHAARYVAIGAVAGIALAVVIANILATNLPGSVSVVRQWIVPFVAASLTLTAVAAVAALIPAARAARMNPTLALREE